MSSPQETELRRLFDLGREDVDYYFPPGDYELRGVNIGNRWTIRGAGMGSTRIKFLPGDGTTCFWMAANEPRDSTNVRFQDFTLNCNWPAFRAAGAAGCTGIGGFLMEGFRCERVEIFNHGSVDADGGGAIFPNNILRVARRIVVRDCWIHDGSGYAHGIALASNNHHNRITYT